MKRFTWVVVLVALIGALGFWRSARNRGAVASEAAGTNSPSSTSVSAENADATSRTPDAPLGLTPTVPTPPRRSPAAAIVPAAVLDEKTQVRQNVDQLVSPQTSFVDKYHIWIKLRDEGKMDQVIAELNERATNNPTAAEYPAALGQAYLHKIAVTKDTRDYAVLGAMADRSFDTALDLEPANWDARFFKATAMSYWPEEMNKRPEVIERFTQLIQDQETQTPQTQFAQSYYWLGETYQKAGRPDDADQVWRRGAALFPSDSMLQQKIAGR